MSSVTELKESLANVKSQVAVVDKLNSLTDMDATLGLKSSAELNISLAFAISSMYFMMMKTKGISTANHPIKEDLARIKQYVGKIRKLDTDSNGDSAAKKRKITVDSEAAKPVVQHELASNKEISSTGSNEVVKVKECDESCSVTNSSTSTTSTKDKKTKKKKNQKK